MRNGGKFTLWSLRDHHNHPAAPILASNCFWASPDGVQHLQSMLEKDPTFETSPNWPQLVEWCSTCTARRFVRVALPPAETTRDKVDSKVEIKPVIKEEVGKELAKEGYELAAGMKVRRRRGGGGSRLRRLLAHQLMLSERWGLPLSRLLLCNKMKTEAKSSKVTGQKVKEMQASPMIKKDVEEKEHEVKVKEEKEKVMPCSAGASTGGQTLSTPRSNQPEEVKPTPEPTLQCPNTPPFANLSSPFYTHTNTSPITYISQPQHFPQFSSPYTPFFISLTCGGLMPGPQWVLCGACHAWGTIMVS